MRELKQKHFCISVIILLFAAFVFMNVQYVSAFSDTRDSKGESFKSKWSHTPINTENRTFKYGYNTTAINEDYTHTYHRTKAHTAYVKNTARTQTKKGSKGSYAKVEIRHASGTVYYRYSY